MVVYAEDAGMLYPRLQALEAAAEAAAGAAASGGAPHLQMHNFVNNADVVPRLLGRSLDPVHDSVEYYVPALRVRSNANFFLFIPCFSNSQISMFTHSITWRVQGCSRWCIPNQTRRYKSHKLGIVYMIWQLCRV